MRRILLVLILAAVSAPALAQPSNRGPVEVTVKLSNFDFTPDRIVLQHGKPYVLHLVSTVGGGHNFDAESFFDAANVDPADQARIRKGKVEVRGREIVDIRLTAPPAGTYPLHCSHFGHTALGMRGRIIVQ